jgi:hypothetical protein
LIEGRYLAELTKGAVVFLLTAISSAKAALADLVADLVSRTEIIADLQQSKYQMTEYRISIYGRCVNDSRLNPALGYIPPRHSSAPWVELPSPLLDARR